MHGAERHSRLECGDAGRDARNDGGRSEPIRSGAGALGFRSGRRRVAPSSLRLFGHEAPFSIRNLPVGALRDHRRQRAVAKRRGRVRPDRDVRSPFADPSAVP